MLWESCNANFSKNLLELTALNRFCSRKFQTNDVAQNSTAVVDLPGVDENSVIKEGDVDVAGNSIEGISETADGKIRTAAGSYVFTVE